MSDYNINGLAIPLFMILMLAEYALLRLQGRSLHRFNDSVNSLSMGLLLLISDALLKAYTFAVFIWLWDNHRLFEFAVNDPITWVVFFVSTSVTTGSIGGRTRSTSSGARMSGTTRAKNTTSRQLFVRVPFSMHSHGFSTCHWRCWDVRLWSL